MFIANSTDRYFHVCNKSISNYNIFSSPEDAQRVIKALVYYNGNMTSSMGLGSFIKNKPDYIFNSPISRLSHNELKILCFCVMPDHYHLLVRIHQKSTLSKYINDVENSYTRYFNIKHNRKGPLWQSRFRSIEIEGSDILLHVSRYIHINVTTANLVLKPEDWPFSSYREFISSPDNLKYIHEISISKIATYKKFVENQIDYQKKLRLIKKHLM